MSHICGIIDIGAKTVSFERLYSMSRAMVRRGEVSGAYINRGSALCGGVRGGSAPLPFTVVRGGRTYTAVLDGEIYNKDELAKAIELTPPYTDAEVAAEAYIAFGYDCASLLDGAFALAIYDEAVGEVYLARDTLGAKPLYYHRDGAKICFASELKGLLRYMRSGIEVDRYALGELIRSGDTSIGGTILYRDADELMAGCFAVCSALGMQVRRYNSCTEGKLVDRWSKAEKTLGATDEPLPNDIRLLMGTILTAFDYPRFDEYMVGYLRVLTELKKLGTTHSVIQDPAMLSDTTFAFERADRLGNMSGLSLGVSAPCEKIEQKRRSLVLQEKKLSLEARALLGDVDSYISREFGKEPLDRLSAERDLKSRIRGYGILIQSELWLKRYPLIIS